MHPLIQRTRNELRRLPADLEAAARRLDADAQELRARIDRTGLSARLSTIWPALPGWLDHAGVIVAAAMAALLRWVDAAALRVESIRPVLLHPDRAARLTRTLAASVLALGLLSMAVFGAVAGSHADVRVDHLAGGRRAGGQEALAKPGTQSPSAAPSAAAAPAVAATGAVGPAVPEIVAAAVAPRTIPANRGALPVGKGMWIWQPDKTEANNADAIVARAKATGLTYVYVRTSSYKGGFDSADFLNRLLPRAHAAGIRVYGWDFPYFTNIDGDVARAVAAINYLTPDGHRIDGFSADIELRSEGVNINNVTAFVYGQKLRAAVGREYPLIATVPRPSDQLVQYPFAEVAAWFDALAPMVYWMANDPAATVTDTMNRLAPFDRPILPIGQAYDGGPEGGPAGVPPRGQLLAFMTAAEKAGAASVSWWSWQHADQQAWDAVRDAPEFQLAVAAPAALSAGQVRAYQVLLHSLGFYAGLGTGAWDGATAQAVADYQRAARLPVTGVIDQATHDTLFTPFAPPIHPTATP